MRIHSVEKVTAEHLKRLAYLYIRQSSLKQVIENTESTKRQYALQERAIALGWSREQVVVIDSDLGESAAAGAADRAGFERLMTDVSMGRAGLVMGLEVSRLARSCSAWHRLLLGLKAAMSEAELHLIRERMRGGALSKAARGELRLRLPVGFVYDEQNRVVLDPDRQVREAVGLLFQTFARLGSAFKTAQYFREQGLKFPKRIHCGPTKGELVWTRLTQGRVIQALYSPRYAEAYAYGRSQVRRGPQGASIARDLPLEKWHALIRDAHSAYISWEAYDRNRRQLQGSANRHNRKGPWPPREGPALLQGLVVCGLCGRRMTVRYCQRRGGLHPNYVCEGRGKGVGMSSCQSLSGERIDEAVGELLLEAVTPVALEVSLAVAEQVRQRFEEADRLRLRQVERARYEVDWAQRRYLQVDPANRLVAEELEADWNRKLRGLREAEAEYERQREGDEVAIDREKHDRILALSRDFPALWHDPETAVRERKRMARLLLEDVTLVKNGEVSVNVRFQGGATRSLTLPRALASSEAWTTSPEVVATIDRLLEEHTYGEIAAILNAGDFSSGQGKSFDGRRVNTIRRAYGLKDRPSRLRAQGYLSAEEVAPKLGTTSRMVRLRRANGTLPVGYRKLSDNGDCMYEDPDAGKEPKTAPMSGRTVEV